MLNKKIFLAFLLVIFIAKLFAPLVNAQSSLDNVGEQIEGKIEDFEGKVDKYADTSFYESKWDYLGGEWKKILLENKFISVVDNFLTKINIVFVFLFGIDYSLTSLVFWLVVFLWFVIAFSLANMLKARFDISYLITLLFGIIGSIILAQLRIFNLTINFLLKLAFASELWYVRLLVFVLIIVGFILISYFSKILSKSLKQDKKKQAEEKTKFRQKKLKKYAEATERN